MTKTGRPLTVEEAGSEKKNFVFFSAGGGRNWGGDRTAVLSAKTNPTMAAAGKNSVIGHGLMTGNIAC